MSARVVLLNPVVPPAGGPNGGDSSGIQTQAYIELALNQLLESHKPASVLIVSIDYLREMYDAKGHAGMRVHEQISKLIRDRHANCFRYGQNAFALVVESEVKAAAKLAESIRADVESFRFEFWPELRATVSVGVASSSPERQTAYRITSAADLALLNGLVRGRLYGEVGSDRNHVFIA